jgi:class 3 adenylate cyclase/tetratricopeptide (TPR) repeat protein
MRCSQCSADNRVGAVYCVACGAALRELCRTCDAPLEARARFCAACGAPTSTGTRPATREGERKPVTVLFCDLVGSTALTEHLGAEAMHGVLDRFFRLASDELARFGCGIHRHLGDGFMTVLGLPRAIEDHAERAVRAGLAVRDRVERDLPVRGDASHERTRVRIGIESGTLVVASLGDDETAVGDTANVASRLQALAEPGEVLVGEGTARLLGGRIRTASIGPVALRGRSAPVTVHRAIGVAPDRGAEAGLERRRFTPFVGREALLAELIDLLDSAVESRGRAVALVGEPGIGKSRLVHEFRRRVTGRRLTVLEGRCLSYGAAIPYAPLADILRANAGLRRRDKPARVKERLAAALEEVGLGIAWLPYLAGLVSEQLEVPSALTPEARKARTFEALRLLCLLGSRRRPLVLIVEDTHWVDPTSEEFLRTLMADVETSPILLVSTHRPGYRPPWLSMPGARELSLGPLEPDDAARMVRSAAEGGPLPPETATAILARAAGNPLFLEELTRAVGDDAIAEAVPAVPPTIHGVIAARIDRLTADLRRVLQTAAVLGREFSPLLLGLVLGDGERVGPALEDLKRGGFLSERPGTPAAFAFKHALIQEVAEGSMLSDRRQRLHRDAGAALESLYAGRTSEVQDRLAYHYSRSGQPETAIVHLERLAADNLRRHAHEEAAAAVREALTQAALLPPERQAPVRLDLTIRLLESLYFLGELVEGERLLAALTPVVESLSDRRAEARFSFWRAHTLSHLGDPDGALAEAQRALSASPSDDSIRARSRYVLARESWWGGRFLEGLVQGRAASLELERGRDAWWLVHCLCYVGHNLLSLGRVDEALEAADRASALGDEAGDPRLRSFAAWSRGIYLATRGDGEIAVAECERALALSPDPANTAWAEGMLGFALAQSGRPAPAAEMLGRALEAIRPTRHHRVECWFGGWLAEAHLLAGDPRRARAVAGNAIRDAERVRVPWAAARALRVAGAAAVAEADLARARSMLLEAHRLQDAMQMPLDAGITALDLAECRLLAGDDAGAADWASTALGALEGRCGGRLVQRARELAAEPASV